MASVNQLFDLSGRVSVVTGGATGLGLQMATALAEAGSNIVVCSRKLESCEKVAAQLEKLGVKALGMAADVTKPDQVEAVKDATLKKFGRVDVLINNAGKAWVAPAEDTPPILVIPYSKTYNDSRFLMNPGFASPRDFLDTMVMGLDELLREGEERRTMMTVAVHARWSGQAARAAAVRMFLEHATQQPGVAFLRRRDIARWWLDTYPPG